MWRRALPLSFVFLASWATLPIFGQDKIDKQAKIVLLFDVSESMSTIDGPAKPGRDPARLPSRQDQVVNFLTDKQPVLDQLLKKAPVTAYRFGATLDDLGVAHFTPGKTWSADEWTRWLKGDGVSRLGTNVAGSALQMLHKERESYVQAIVVFSDGRSNRTTKDEVGTFLAWVNDANGPLPVFTVGVGGFETLPNIRVGQLQAPEEVRPDDKFPVRVPIRGSGLDGQAFQVLLEAQRVTDVTGQPVVRDKRFLPGPRMGKFTGENQQIEFDIDLTALKKDEIEGTWQFTARVPSHPREPFAGSEHASEPVSVVVQNKRLRVLLFAGAPTREYQFLRTMLLREVSAKRVELSVHLQSGQDDSIDAERLLKDFPNKLAPNGKAERFMSLSDYDAIVTFDPDWTKLTLDQRALLKTWVSEHAGGIIFVAGPVNTFHLARPAGQDLSSLLPLYPVVLRDSRLHGLSVTGGAGHDITRSYPLNFSPKAKDFPFLKLDPMGEGPTAGWNGFFWNDEQFKPGQDAKPKRGFFSYYPVERLKPASQVAAAFAGPKESRIGDKSDQFKDQQPFIVTMPVGAGKSLYLSSGELWRLRAYKEPFYDRLWLGMIRHVARQAAIPKPIGRILMDRTAAVGAIPIDGQLFKNAAKLLIEVAKTPPEGVKPMAQELRADAAGRFAGVIIVKEPGDYVVRVSVPGGTDFVSQRIAMRKADTDADDTRVDFAALYQLASKAEPVLRGLPETKRKEIEVILAESAKYPGAPASQDHPWLFFRLSAADAIASCLEKLPPMKVARVKPPKAPAVDPGAEIKTLYQKPKPPVKVLIIDGEGKRGRQESRDSFCIEQAIDSIPKKPFQVVFGDEVSRAHPVAALERDDLGNYGAIFLLNVRDLSEKQLDHLEKFTRAGGGLGFFLGPNVDLTYYNKHLYKQGSGLFPAPLQQIYPSLTDNGLDRAVSQLLLRGDLFPDPERYPILGELFDHPVQAAPLKMLPIDRYVKVARADWRPATDRAQELATLANPKDAATLAKAVLAAFRGPHFMKMQEDDGFKKYRPALDRHRAALEDLVRPGADKKAADLVDAIDAMLRDRGKANERARYPDLKELWQTPDADVRSFLEAVVKLRHEARYGDPFILGGHFGKGRVVAVLSTAGKEWNDFAGGSIASMVYPAFVWETVNYLTQQPPRTAPQAVRPPAKGQPPQFENVGLAYEPQKLTGKDVPKELADAWLVTPDAAVPPRGFILDGAGVQSAHWVVQVHPVEVAKGKFGKKLAAQPEERLAMRSVFWNQDRRAHEQLLREFIGGAKDRPFPTGLSTIHALGDEAFDFRQHLGRLKAKKMKPQDNYVVKLWLDASSADAKAGMSRTQSPLVFLVVSENEWLVHANRQSAKIYERMEAAMDKMSAARKRLDEQIVKLPAGAGDLPGILGRVADVHRDVRFVAGTLDDAARFYERFQTEMEINRLHNDRAAMIGKIAESLHSSQGSPRAAFDRADEALLELSASLVAGKKDTLLRKAQTAKDRLQALDKAMTMSLESVAQLQVEAKLTELLLELEKKQRDKKP